MKKFVLLGAILLMLLVVIPLAVEAAPVLTVKNAYVHQNTFLLWVTTDITTTATLSYGTSQGNLDTTVEAEHQGVSHTIKLQDLVDETTYYYRFDATAIDESTSSTGIDSFTTGVGSLRFDSIILVGTSHNKAVVKTTTSVYGVSPKIYYSTSPDSLSEDGYSRCGYRCSGMGSKWTHYFENLNANTTYYYKIVMTGGQHGDGAETDVLSFATTGIPQITSINPTSGSVGTQVTLSGKNFGVGPDKNPYSEYTVGFGCDINTGEPPCLANIISWGDSEIVVEVASGAESGTTYLRKSSLFTIDGPAFTVTGISQPTQNTNTTTTNTTTTTQPVVNYVDSAYGCSYSTTTQGDDTIKVSTLFTDGSETDTYLESVYNLYNDNWGRYPRCSEMQFHLDHSTPVDRLANWLTEETINEKYGCKYSTSFSDANTIKVKSLFILDSDNDTYLGQVYNAYYDNWGRYPRCDELQFHLDHSTSIARLNSWLEENKTEEATATETDLPPTPSEITGSKIEFEDVGTTVGLADESQSLSFKDTDEITFTGTTTPNSLVTLEIASEVAMVVTTRSNSDGHWVYTLPGPLETGDHTVKVTVADTSGVKLSESEAISFKVTSTSSVTSTISDTLEDAGFTTTTWIIIAAAAVVIIVLITVIVKKKPAQSESKE